MDKNETFKLPRLFTTQELQDKSLIPLDKEQAHYLHTVLRRKDGDFIRLFNGRHGEWLGKIQNLAKRSGEITLTEQLVQQPLKKRRLHLFFPPIKKNRMGWLIEKAVELGATDFHPILTQNTQNSKINEERLKQQIFEAAEQCERFDIPALHDLQKIENKLADWNKDIPILACIERFNTKPLSQIADNQDKDKDIAFLIGPEGGFTSAEKTMIARTAIPVGLGETILRCETAVVKALVLITR